MPYMCRYSIIHVAHTFLPATQLFFCWRDFSLLVRLSLAGATFFRWRDCFFAGATFFCWRDFFVGATFFRWRDFFLYRSFVDRC